MCDIIFYFQTWQDGREFKGSRTDTDFCKFAEWYHQKREQERQGPAPDRDELAMTMPVDHLSKLKGINMFENIGEEIVSKQVDGILADIKSSLGFDARVRYMYADAMLKARKVEPVQSTNPDPDLQHIQNVLDTCDRLGCTPAELLKMNYMSELKK